MDQSQVQSSVRGVSVISLVLGAWFIVSPYILVYETTAELWNQTIVGIVISVFALWRLVNPFARWASWVDVLAGLWLILAPFALSYSKPIAYWNEIITAIVLVVLTVGGASTRLEPTFHHRVHHM